MTNKADKITGIPESIESGVIITYRSTGLGLYGMIMRYAGMPLEKIALYMNSAQVSGKNQFRQAMELAFRDGKSRSFLAPYKVVGAASGVAWFLQYSVMGMVFQVCDKALSNAMDVPLMPYGEQLMEDPSCTSLEQKSSTDNYQQGIKYGFKIIFAPMLAGTFESVVANRAEVQRYFGLTRFSQIESSLKWNPISRICGPAFLVNSSRNTIMSATSFVITPVLYKNYFPQEHKSKSSLLWFGLGVNIFGGNTIAITQQALWGRALDYANATGNVARNIHYNTVIKEGLKKEGIHAFYTVPKWASRVLMNAPVQGTLPWFYNEVLPLAEGSLLRAVNSMYTSLFPMNSSNQQPDEISYHPVDATSKGLKQ